MVERKFPHLKDELSDRLKNTIEDDFKFHAELALEAANESNNPSDKWNAYTKFVAWVTYCDRAKIKITNRSEVYGIMNTLWTDVRNSPLYKPKPNT